MAQQSIEIVITQFAILPGLQFWQNGSIGNYHRLVCIKMTLKGPGHDFI